MRRAKAARCLTAPGRIIVALAVAGMCVFAVTGCGRGGGQQETSGRAEASESKVTPVQVATAMRADLQETLEITGTAEAEGEVDVVAEVAGKVARVYADVGDYVSAGQTIVRVDSKIAAAQRDQASAGVQSAEAALRQARSSLELTEETTASSVRQAEVNLSAAKERLKQAEASARLTQSRVESQIEQARTALRSAQTQLAEVRAGARQQQRRQAEQQVRQAKASLDLAEQTYRRHKGLLEGGVISQQQFDQVETQYELAQASYKQAQENLSLVEEGARTEQVRLAELAVEQAEEGLRLAEAGRTQIEIAQQDVEAAREGVRAAEEQLRAAISGRKQVDVSRRSVAAAEAGVAQAQASARAAGVQLQKHAIPSPLSGLVARRYVDPGEGAAPGSPLLRIVDIDPIRIEAVVNQLDIDRVSKGDRGMVTFDGLEDREFVGTVTDISPQAVKSSRNYIARIEVDNPGGVVKPGMFARVKLVLGSVQGAVVVARDALVERDHTGLVYVVDDGVIDVREVRVGVIQDNLVEILEGVREGETVVVIGQDELADGQRVRAVPRTQVDETQ